jgi:hypothetical protein
MIQKKEYTSNVPIYAVLSVDVYAVFNTQYKKYWHIVMRIFILEWISMPIIYTGADF